MSVRASKEDSQGRGQLPGLEKFLEDGMGDVPAATLGWGVILTEVGPSKPHQASIVRCRSAFSCLVKKHGPLVQHAAPSLIMSCHVIYAQTVLGTVLPVHNGIAALLPCLISSLVGTPPVVNYGFMLSNRFGRSRPIYQVVQEPAGRLAIHSFRRRAEGCLHGAGLG